MIKLQFENYGYLHRQNHKGIASLLPKTSYFNNSVSITSQI